MILSSANALNLVQVKILSFAKELNIILMGVGVQGGGAIDFFHGGCRARSACTYKQTDLDLHCLLFWH